VEFICPLIAHYNEIFLETTLFLRGDSGFAAPALYELCEKESVLYTIRIKSNPQLQSLAKEYHPSSTSLDVSKTETYFEETIYQAKSWSKPEESSFNRSIRQANCSLRIPFSLQILE